MKHRLPALLLVLAMLLSMAFTGCVLETARVSIVVDPPRIGSIVDYTHTSVTVNETQLSRNGDSDDSTSDKSDTATYSEGKYYTVEWRQQYEESGWSADAMAWDDVFVAEDDDGDRVYYTARINFMVDKKYKGNVEYSCDGSGYIESSSETLSADGKWLICEVLVSFRPEKGCPTADVELDVPEPVFGETCADASSKITFALNGTALTLTDSTDYENPATYADGTLFAVMWAGHEEHDAGFMDYDADHVFSEEDEFSGRVPYIALVYYAVPADYGITYMSEDSVAYGHCSLKTRTDDWNIYMIEVSFENVTAPAEVVISIDPPSIGSMVMEYYGASITVNGTRLYWNSDYDGEWKNVANYMEGTCFALEWWPEYEEGGWGDAMASDDVFVSEDSSGNRQYYSASIHFVLDAKYQDKTNVTCEGPGYLESCTYSLTDDGKWLRCEAMVSFQPDDVLHDDIFDAEAELSVPDPVLGETVADAIEKISFTLNGTVLSRNSEAAISDDNSVYSDPSLYADGTKYIAVWWGYNSEIGTGGVDPYPMDHVFSEKDVCSEDGSGDTILSDVCIYFAMPAEYGIIYYSEGSDNAYCVLIARAGEWNIYCADVSFEINAEHIWGAWVINRQPTCTEQGKHSRTCTVCGAQETEVMPALGHSYTYTRTVGNYHKVVCSRCGDNFEEKCTYNNGSRCIYCGEIIIVY